MEDRGCPHRGTCHQHAAFSARGEAAAPQSTAGRGAAVASMARLSGSVTAPTAFKAAQVYIRNVDKNIAHMVFTSAGQFRAVSLSLATMRYASPPRDSNQPCRKLR